MKRADAAAAGLLQYNTGLPCKYGHLAPRYVSTGGCLQCLRGYGKQFRIDTNFRRQGFTVFPAVRVPPESLEAFRSMCAALNVQLPDVAATPPPPPVVLPPPVLPPAPPPSSGPWVPPPGFEYLATGAMPKP